MVLFLYECCRIPKIHFILHIPRIMRRMGWYCDTLAWERKHREVKQFLDQAKGNALDYCHKHVNRRMLLDFFKALSDPRFFLMCQLLHPLKFTKKKQQFVETAFGIVLEGECFYSRTCQCARGLITENHMVLVMAPSLVVGKVLLIAEDESGVVLVLDIYRKVGPYVYTSMGEVRLCDPRHVCCITPSIDVPSGQWVLLPDAMSLPNY